MSKIHVLYVGDDDWTTKYSIPDNIEFEVYESDESELTANRPARKLMDLVILDRDITLSEEKAFTKFTRGYCLFATENVQMLNSATSRYFKARMGQYLYTGDVQYFLAHEVRNYYPNPYGEKFNPAKLAVSDSFTGRVACDGNYNLVLDGEFGENFSQIAYWRYNIPVFEGQCIDMYLEYEKTGDVEIKLRLFQFYYGSIGDIKQVWEFDEEQLQDVFRIDNESDQGPVFVSILARGTGSLNIISLHDRHSRRGHGFFLPGGERLVSSKGEEVFVYFEKGDMKPPLAVYFSGYRTQEGFEGYYMMRGFGCPFILVTDPRSEGGAFYLGDSEFEQMITDYVTDKLDELGLTKDELVLSGASMGTFGSLYYGSKLSPHALLLAKPLTILGYVLVIVALLIVLPVVLPPIFGYHTYLSGTDHTGNISKNGSVVYLKTIDEAAYKDGNIVAIESADSSGRRVDSYYVDSNDSSAKEIALRDGNGVSYKVVKGQVIAKTPFIGYLSQLCFSAVGIIVTVVIFAAGVAIMMYVNKISKEINTMVEQQTA